MRYICCIGFTTVFIFIISFCEHLSVLQKVIRSTLHDRKSSINDIFEEVIFQLLQHTHTSPKCEKRRKRLNCLKQYASKARFFRRR